MSILLIWLLIDIGMGFSLPIDQQRSNEGWLCCQSWLFLSCFFPILMYIEIGNGTLCNDLTASKQIWYKWQEITDSKFVINTL